MCQKECTQCWGIQASFSWFQEGIWSKYWLCLRLHPISWYFLRIFRLSALHSNCKRSCFQMSLLRKSTILVHFYTNLLCGCIQPQEFWKKFWEVQKYHLNLNYLEKLISFYVCVKLSAKEVYGHFIIPFFEELKWTKIGFEFIKL